MKLVEHCEKAEERLAKLEKMAKNNTLMVSDSGNLEDEIGADEMWDAGHPKEHKSRAQQIKEAKAKHARRGT